MAHRAPGGPRGRRRTVPFGLLLGAVLAVALGTAGAVWGLTRASDGATTASAAYLPQDTLFYLTLTTDAASRQWVQTAGLLRRLGVDATARQNRDQSAGGAGLTWDSDVAPFLGGDLTIAVIDAGAAGAPPTVVAMMSVTDGGKAWAKLTAVLDQQATAPAGTRTYRDATLRTYGKVDGVALVAARRADLLLLGTSEQALTQALDLAAGEGDSLAASSRFQKARASVAGEVLTFAYLDVAKLATAGAARADLSAMLPVDSLLGASGLDHAALALALSAEPRGFKLEWQLTGYTPPAGAVTPAAPASGTPLAARVPDDALVYLSGQNLYGNVLTAMRRTLAQAQAQGGTAAGVPPLDDILARLSEELGFDVEHDLLAQLTGEFGLAAGAGAAAPADAWVLGLAQVADSGAVGRALSSFAEWERRQGHRLATGTAAGVTVTEVRPGSGDEGFSYALAGNDLLAGYGTGTVGRALRADGRLANDPVYLDALQALPANRTMTAFVNLQRLVALARAVDDPDVAGIANAPAARNLRSLAFAATAGEGSMGGVLVLRIAE